MSIFKHDSLADKLSDACTCYIDTCIASTESSDAAPQVPGALIYLLQTHSIVTGKRSDTAPRSCACSTHPRQSRGLTPPISDATVSPAAKLGSEVPAGHSLEEQCPGRIRQAPWASPAELHRSPAQGQEGAERLLGPEGSQHCSLAWPLAVAAWQAAARRGRPAARCAQEACPRSDRDTGLRRRQCTVSTCTASVLELRNLQRMPYRRHWGQPRKNCMRD